MHYPKFIYAAQRSVLLFLSFLALLSPRLEAAAPGGVENSSSLVNGINYEFYSGVDADILDGIDGTLLQTGYLSGFYDADDIFINELVSKFSILLTSQLDIQADGTYYFRFESLTAANDAAIYINNILVDSWCCGLDVGAGNSAGGSIALTAGLHDLEVRFADDGASILRVQWSTDGTNWDYLPDSVLFTTPSISSWHKADAGIANSDGESLTAWQDQSANANHVTPNASHDAPTYYSVSPDELYNFNPTVNFLDGRLESDDQASGFAYDEQGRSVFAVLSADDSNTHEMTVTGYGRHVGNWAFRLRVHDHNLSANFGGGNFYEVTGDDDIFLNTGPMLAGITTSNPNLVASNNVLGYVNGIQNIAGTTRDNLQTRIDIDHDFSIGHCPDFCPNLDEFDGKIAEVIHYPWVLSADERKRVESYLALKYGITLGLVFDTYVNSAGTVVFDLDENNDLVLEYDHVAGLIRDDASDLNQRIASSMAGIDNSVAVNLTVSTDAVFTGPSSGHADTLSDGQSLVWAASHDSVATTASSNYDASAYERRIDRTWKIQDVGGVGEVNLQFTGLSSTSPNQTYVLVVDEDTDFTSGSVVLGSSTTGTFEDINFPDNGTRYFAIMIQDPDTVKPVITLDGDNPFELEVFSVYSDPGASASDDRDGDISANINVDSSALNNGVLGNYSVTYNVSDAAGNAADEVSRSVRVVDTVAPEITLLGDNPMSIPLLGRYEEPGATANDAYDGFVAVVIGGSVDNTTPGTYFITYNAIDGSGNPAVEVVRTVNVASDSTAPEITVLGDDPLNVEAGTAFVDPGAFVTDNVDTDLVPVVGGDTVDTGVLASYLITYDAEDSSGNVADQKSRAVVVADTQKPLLNLLGDGIVSIAQGGTYTEQGVSAIDSFEGDLSLDVIITGSVDTSTADTYVLSYNVSDSSGNAADAVTRTVIVTADAVAPVITLSGDAVVTIEVGGTYTEPGATATDNIDGDIAVVIGGDTVNTATPGTYVLTYDAQDSAGNNAPQKTRQVNVVDSTGPVITLNGDSNVQLEINESYVEQGAVASDNLDADFLATPSGVVNTSVEGVYTISYTATDSQGNSADVVIRTITVGPDVTAPVITLLGDNPLSLGVGQAYADPGVVITDNVDSGLQASVAGDAVDTATAGSYTVTYDAVDNAGNAADQVTRTVIVEPDSVAPELTLLGDSPMTVEVGSQYVEPNATAFDEVDGNLTADIVIDATAVNTAVLGLYSVTYNVMDAAGNAAAEQQRIVSVVDTSKPTITLVGASPFEIALGTSYVDPGYVAIDNLDGDITDKVTVDSSGVDTSIVGSYTVSYNVSDSEGNAADQVLRSVTVTPDTVKPVITLEGGFSETVDLYAAFDDPGASASDNVDGDISADIVVTGSVDTTAEGIYELSYDVADAAGNNAETVNRVVFVVESALSAAAREEVIAAAASGDASSVTVEDLNAINGVDNTVAGNEAAYQAAIAAADPSDVDSTEEIIALIESVNNQQLVIAAADTGDGSAITADTLNGIQGVSGATIDNLALYQAAIAAADPAEVDSPEELQALIDSINALQAVQDAAAVNDASTIGYADLNTIIGVDGALADNEAAYQAAIASADPADVDSAEEVQSLIDQVNSTEALTAVSDAAGGDASGISIDDLLSIDGLVNVVPENEAAYQAAISAAAPGSLATLEDLQALIDEVNSAEALAAVADAAGGDASAITADDLNAIDGVSGALVENEALYQAAIEAAAPGELTSPAEIQAMIDAVNASAAALAEIAEAADLDDASGISLEDLQAVIGVTGIDSDNLEAYRLAIEASDSASLTDADSLQALIDMVNTQVALDTDGDGVNNFYDTDDDGDLLPDDLDPNDQNSDTDGDGIPDGADADVNGDGIIDNGPDSDDDGINDAADANGSSKNDLDGDGLINEFDNDADGDGLIADVDGDDLNPDQDGDGIPDGADADINGDGLIDNGPDTDGDGINDSADADVNGDGLIDNGSDFEGDGINDLIDQDDDNDGLVDSLDPDSTRSDMDGDGIPDGADADVNGDGIVDNGVDTDGDGINDAADADVNGDGIVDNGPDTDGDGIIDALDNDDDGDTIPDHLDTNPVNADTDGDGITDNIDADVDGDGTLDNGADADGDGIIDAADADFVVNGLDLDGDGIIDGVDINGDGILTGLELIELVKDLDFDNDGIPNIAEFDVNRDGIADDSDGDGIPDIYDADSFNSEGDGSGDSDGDQRSDLIECAGFPLCDMDDNGVLDHLERSITVPPEVVEVDWGSNGGSIGGALFWSVLCIAALRRRAAAGIAIAISMLGFWSAAANAAQPSPDSGRYYIGTGAGVSFISPEITGDLNEYDFPDQKDVAFALYGGYAINPSWSAELQYSDLGETELVNESSAMILGGVEYRAASLAALRYFEIPGGCGRYCKLDPFVALGVSYIDASDDVSPVVIDHQSNSQVSASIGAEYTIRSDWTLRAIATGFSESAGMVTVGISKYFGDRSQASQSADNAATEDSRLRDMSVEGQSPDGQLLVDWHAEDALVDEGEAAPALEFALGSTELTSRSVSILDQLAEALSQDASSRMLIMGHADPSGGELVNWRLAQERADKAKAYLVDAGVSPERLVTTSTGSQDPRYANIGDFGRAKNRRVIFMFLN